MISQYITNTEKDSRLDAERFSIFFYSSKSSIYSTFLLRSMLGTISFQYYAVNSSTNILFDVIFLFSLTVS